MVDGGRNGVSVSLVARDVRSALRGPTRAVVRALSRPRDRFAAGSSARDLGRTRALRRCAAPVRAVYFGAVATVLPGGELRVWMFRQRERERPCVLVAKGHVCDVALACVDSAADGRQRRSAASTRCWTPPMMYPSRARLGHRWIRGPGRPAGRRGDGRCLLATACVATPRAQVVGQRPRALANGQPGDVDRTRRSGTPDRCFAAGHS
jgi:hypothetical protein